MHSYEWLWGQIHQRDGALLLFLIFLLGVWLWIDSAYDELQRFLKDRPDARRQFTEWRAADRLKRQRLCPEHKLYIPPGRSCPSCGWKPDRR